MAFVFYYLHLIFLRLFYGTLSSRYFFAIKRFRKIYPTFSGDFTNCINNEVILHLDKLCFRKKGLPVYITPDPVQFDGCFYGISVKHLHKIKGKPETASYEWVGEKLVKVFGYRDKILERGVKINFFFTDDQFFLGEFQFQSYNKTILDNVRGMLQAKYHFKAGIFESDFYITDREGSLIFFNDSGYRLTVQYYFRQLKPADQYFRKIITNSQFFKDKERVEEFSNRNLI